MPFLASEGCFWPLTAVMRLLESNIIQPNTTQVTSYEQCKINSNQKFSNTINHAQHFFNQNAYAFVALDNRNNYELIHKFRYISSVNVFKNPKTTLTFNLEIGVAHSNMY